MLYVMDSTITRFPNKKANRRQTAGMKDWCCTSLGGSWSRSPDLNREPPAYKTGALPLELLRLAFVATLLMLDSKNPVESQSIIYGIRYIPSSPARDARLGDSGQPGKLALGISVPMQSLQDQLCFAFFHTSELYSNA
jgi:hypothetical protein